MRVEWRTRRSGVNREPDSFLVTFASVRGCASRASRLALAMHADRVAVRFALCLFSRPPFRLHHPWSAEGARWARDRSAPLATLGSASAIQAREISRPQQGLLHTDRGAERRHDPKGDADRADSFEPEQSSAVRPVWQLPADRASSGTDTTCSADPRGNSSESDATLIRRVVPLFAPYSDSAFRSSAPCHPVAHLFLQSSGPRRTGPPRF